ncbi:MAG: hypothetical protein AB7K64_12460 [Variibacter sp.]
MSKPSARALRSYNAAVDHLAHYFEACGLAGDLAFNVAADACHSASVVVDRALAPLVAPPTSR